MALETFDVQHRGEVKRTIHYNDRIIAFESGAEQVQQVGINPDYTFQFSYQGSAEDIDYIETFYNSHRLAIQFYLNYCNAVYTVRFTSDFAVTDTWGWSDDGYIIPQKRVELTMKVVY